MTNDATEKLLHALSGIGSSILTSRMASKNGDLYPAKHMGMGCRASGPGCRNHGSRPATSALQGYAFLTFRTLRTVSKTNGGWI